MIESKDRSYFFGASDTDKIVGKWGSYTWCKWWLQKLSINYDSFTNMYTEAGTHFEHRILEALDIPMELDRQIINEDLRLRVNLDGNTDDTIYECKTYKYDSHKPWKIPQKYINQVQVQMFSDSKRKAYIVAYGLTEKDYLNYLADIDKDRLKLIPVDYNEKWINGVYLPKLQILSQSLKEGRFPI